jgi:regulator of RNase E activity RraA
MTHDDPLDFDWMRRALYTAVVADVLDALGLREQVVGTQLRCVSGGGLLVGRAKTTRWEEIDQIDPRPYELELKAVDECRANEVLIAAAGGSTRSGVWGELLSTAARNRGCAGAIVDGAVRDVAKMHDMGFTVFARSVCSRDSLHRQRVEAIDVAVTIGGVHIEPGDLVLADADGMVVVPRAVERDAIEKAREKVTAENRVRDEIRAGMKAAEVFRKYGVL